MINFIDSTAILGFGTQVWHFAVVLADVRTGNDVSIGSGSEIGRGTFIGARSRISAHVFLPTNSAIGEDVFIGPGVTFTDDRYPRAGNKDYVALPPVIESGASIGAGSVILPGIVIGRGAMVGAGSVVTKSIPAGCTVYGPAASPRPVPLRDDTYSSLFTPALMQEPDVTEPHPAGSPS